MDRRGLTKYLGTTVHDENVAAVPANEAEDYAREMHSAMIEGMHKVLPLTVKAEIKRMPDGSLPDYWLP
jgi:DNA polymerase I-like protein with 3'-5' exonuclease and polymerase domains